MSEFEIIGFEKLKDDLVEFFHNPRLKNKLYKFKEIRKVFSGEKGYKINVVRIALQELEFERKYIMMKEKMFIELFL